MSRTAILGLAESLQRTVAAITYRPGASVWTGYNAGTSYTEAAHRHKQQLVEECVASVSSPSPPRLVWDLGANDGTFSRIAASTGAQVVSMDMDYAVVERHYRACVTRNETHVLPLVQDLLNPTGGLGWNGDERQGLVERGPADIVLALAVIHHLAIGGNVPFDVMTTFLARLGRHLIVEFVPKDDIQVNSMLATREDVFQSYTQGHFEEAFGKRYHIRRVAPIAESRRVLYLMETR